MPSDPNRIKEIFLEASELPEEAARGAYLDRACGSDGQLRDRVEALLHAHDLVGGFLGSPAVAPPVPDQDDGLQDFLSSTTRPDSLGRLGHYELLQVLGKGGFGVVFRAFDDVLQRVVALKIMRPQIAATSPARKRFLREARASAAVRHENVVQVYEVAEQPLPYLVMEFIPGETLQQKLDRTGPLDVSEVLRIGRQIAEGLAAAHASDLIHRDIKLGNILLESGSQKVKITDFGLARAADDASISHSGVIAGTPMFMAPEQALGNHVDQRADLFSFGSVLYQMVCGRPPFRAPSALAVLKRVAEEAPRAIPEIIPETPQWLCDIISKLHAKNPDERYQSAREVADVLADCERQLVTRIEGNNVSRILDRKPATDLRLPWTRSRIKSAVVSGLVLVALLAPIVIWWHWPTAAPVSRQLGELEILPADGLARVIVLQNDDGIVDGNKLHPRVTDWLDMKKPQKLTVPPGKYQLNVGTWPAGTTVREWEVVTDGALGSLRIWMPVIDTSAIITVERGQHVTLRPCMKAAPVQAPVVPNGL